MATTFRATIFDGVRVCVTVDNPNWIGPPGVYKATRINDSVDRFMAENSLWDGLIPAQWVYAAYAAVALSKSGAVLEPVGATSWRIVDVIVCTRDKAA